MASRGIRFASLRVSAPSFTCGIFAVRVVSPAAFEWFEWLYDRMRQYPASPNPAAGAHVTRKDWKP